jgi:hypothetical protein
MTGEAHDDYAWNQRRDEVVITRHGRPATILRRSAALRFLDRVRVADAAQAQQLMARVTGNFKPATSVRRQRGS